MTQTDKLEIEIAKAEGFIQGYKYSDRSARDYFAYPEGELRDAYYDGMDEGERLAAAGRRNL